MQMYIEGMCGSTSATIPATSTGPGGAFDSPSGCPQWEVPWVGTSAPGRCMQLGCTGAAGWCPEASS
jgi:hypothetical protein